MATTTVEVEAAAQFHWPNGKGNKTKTKPTLNKHRHRRRDELPEAFSSLADAHNFRQFLTLVLIRSVIWFLSFQSSSDLNFIFLFSSFLGDFSHFYFLA